MAKDLFNKMDYNTLGKISKHSPKHDLDYSEKSKGMSFFAFVFSVFVYTSVFYVLDISPSTLFSNTKFWFFISNTLILIIAADYGAFTSSKGKQLDKLYEELAGTQRISCHGAPEWHTLPEEAHEPMTKHSPFVKVDSDHMNGTEEKDQVAYELHNESETKEHQTIHDIKLSDDKPVFINEEHDCAFWANDGLVKVTDEGDNNHIEGEEVCGGMNEGEGDEFSAMSDEELNKRVEEFILKLKRQIRLQGVGDFG